MIVFLDSSVLLRKLFGERDQLAEWTQIRSAYASRLLAVDVGRVIDRGRLAGDIDDEQVADLHGELRRVLRSIELRPLTEAVLERAAAAMPTVLGTLDAIHLASALEVAGSLSERLTMATHDQQLGRAARASGLEVVGL